MICGWCQRKIKDGEIESLVSFNNLIRAGKKKSQDFATFCSIPKQIPSNRKKVNMNIILSIHPKWAKFIYEGKKTLEWRKNTPNADFIDEVFLYETAPVRKVTGFFMYDHYFSLVLTGDDKPRDGADVLLDRGCVPLDELKKYAGRKKEIFGWKFYKVRKFDFPKSLDEFGLKRPPQSWCYTDRNITTLTRYSEDKNLKPIGDQE